MSEDDMNEDILEMARAAQHDDRLADGALYGKLADKIEQMQKALREADIYLSVLLAEVPDPAIRKGMRDTLNLIDAARR
jgi:hypothetical protein